MIYRNKILAALESRRTDFAHFQSDLRDQLGAYGEALDQINSISRDELIARLNKWEAPGALPVEERDIVIPFDHEWQNREEARLWGFETLLGRTTFSADGSQILPSKDFSVPVAAVQVGWFENPHTPGGNYVKDAAFEILSPAEVMVRTGGATEISEQVVHMRRYGLEVGVIKNFMNGVAVRGFDAAKPPVVFFDSLLVISFAELLPDEQRERYVADIVSLLCTSKQTGVPVIGYVDTSFARDLINMMQAVFSDLSDAQKVHDALLLAPRMKWGDRTALFRCARRGILDSYGDEWRRNVAFLYLKTSSDGPPSRLDVPMWVYERGLLDYVVDTARGEVIVGNGYPYAIEAADQTAVLDARDREMFYAIFQEFAERERLNLSLARKAVSKAHRR
ncbi:MAG TPA: DNA double-strand break repair nuclease NurA [Blastocatellia bacterium]|nr:DNA double-strand break repair nuclease NurA [Blastocatellia bacterium]